MTEGAGRVSCLVKILSSSLSSYDLEDTVQFSPF